MSVISTEQMASVFAEVIQKLGVRVESAPVAPRHDGSVLAGPVELGETVGKSDVNGGESVSGGSWSEEMNEVASVDSDRSVEMPVGFSPSNEVKKVKFGGAGDIYPFNEPKATQSFYSTYVRVDRVRSLASFVQTLSGSKLPKKAMRDLALCTYAAGSIPDSFDGGKERLKGLAVVGDSYLTSHIVVLAVQAGKTVSSVQSLRSQCTSDSTLSAAFVKKGMAKFITTPSGIDLATSKTSATMVEAVIGVVALYREMETVSKLIASLGIVSVSV